MIKIDFNKEFKSFPGPASYSFQGALIVLVGDNGSGKSHLLEMMTEKNLIGFNSEMYIDDLPISKENIISRTFQSNPQNSSADVNFVNTVTDSLFNFYQHGNLDPNFSNSINLLKETLSSTDIDEIKRRDPTSQEKLKEKLRSKLKTVKNLHTIWQYNDIFSSQNLSTIFREYTVQISEYCAEYKHEIYKKSEERFYLENPKPWETLNSLFNKLGFEYKFKDHYKIDDEDYRQNIALFNKKDKKLTYNVDGLSSGEKQIFSLVISAFNLANLKDSSPKLLLLDEYDATLNPALIDAYFKIIKEFYLEKGHKVIMASHSTDTIYGAHKILGEDIPKFYKVNKLSDENANDINKRIEKISEDENTYAFITYKVFGVYSNDLHNYLYGYIQSEEDLKDKEMDNFFISKAKKYNLVDFKNKLNYWKKDGTEMSITLPTFIRHKIHHPENKNPKNRPDFTPEELKDSTDFLLKIKEEIDISEHLYKK